VCQAEFSFWESEDQAQAQAELPELVLAVGVWNGLWKNFCCGFVVQDSTTRLCSILEDVFMSRIALIIDFVNIWVETIVVGLGVVQ
jgi:hypothetical protein